MSDDQLDRLHQVLSRFAARVREELEHRVASWPTDLSKESMHAVIGGLLARQATLAREMASSPPTWNAHVAPLLLRAMADVHISLIWILRDPEARSDAFMKHGLGQAKLQLEHRRADLERRESEGGDLGAGEREGLRLMERWIEEQRALFLTEVNLGSWSGLPTRKMAEEADCLDFYNFVYTPFSACAHSTWEHIAKYNLRDCSEPLHRWHRVATISEPPLDVHYLLLGAKYLAMSLASFDAEFKTSFPGTSARDLLDEELGA